VLGDFNDSAVAERSLRDWSTRARARDVIFAAGELAGLERAAEERGPPRMTEGVEAALKGVEDVDVSRPADPPLIRGTLL
jgi:hypothetical protein